MSISHIFHIQNNVICVKIYTVLHGILHEFCEFLSSEKDFFKQWVPKQIIWIQMDIFALKKLARNEFFSEIINFPSKITNQGFWYNKNF